MFLLWAQGEASLGDITYKERRWTETPPQGHGQRLSRSLLSQKGLAMGSDVAEFSASAVGSQQSPEGVHTQDKGVWRERA